MKETTRVALWTGAAAALVSSAISTVAGVGELYCGAQQRRLDAADYYLRKMRDGLTDMEQATRQPTIVAADVVNAVGKITRAANIMQSGVDAETARLAKRLMAAAQTTGDATINNKRNPDEVGAFDNARDAYLAKADAEVKAKQALGICFLTPDVLKSASD